MDFLIKSGEQDYYRVDFGSIEIVVIWGAVLVDRSLKPIGTSETNNLRVGKGGLPPLFLADGFVSVPPA